MFGRILLAVDGTEAGEVATSFVRALARQPGATVRVLHVHELVAMRSGGVGGPAMAPTWWRRPRRCHC